MKRLLSARHTDASLAARGKRSMLLVNTGSRPLNSPNRPVRPVNHPGSTGGRRLVSINSGATIGVTMRLCRTTFFSRKTR